MVSRKQAKIFRKFTNPQKFRKKKTIFPKQAGSYSVFILPRYTVLMEWRLSMLHRIATAARVYIPWVGGGVQRESEVIGLVFASLSFWILILGTYLQGRFSLNSLLLGNLQY